MSTAEQQRVSSELQGVPSERQSVSAETLRSISTPDRVESRLGTLEDSASLFLTANCDTVYFLSFMDLSDGPITDAVTVGNATARTLSFAPRQEEGWAYYPGSAWFNMLFTGGHEFLDPPPLITADGAVPVGPSDGARKLNARTAFFYPYTGITPAMCMRVPGIGSQYLVAMRDSAGEYLDGARGYRLTLPPDIPESRFWSVVIYDNQTRSMLQTDQPRPDLGNQSGTVTTNPDGTTDIYFGPTAPVGREGNWLQTVPGKGWFAILRLYNPLPSFFDKTWRPSEIEPA